MYKRRLACIAYQTFHNVAPDDINNLFTKHETSYRFKRLFKIASKCVLNPTRYLILSLIVPALFGIAYLAKPSYSSLKASIKKFFKRIDQINFGTNSTATNNISDEFMYY